MMLWIFIRKFGKKISNKSSKKSYSGASTSSKGRYKQNYVSPYRYNKGASPYRYAVNNKIRSNVNNNKNSINQKKNSPFKYQLSKNNNIYNEVKKNNYVIKEHKYNNKHTYHKEKNDYKTIGDRLSKIQNLIQRANAK